MGHNISRRAGLDNRQLGDKYDGLLADGDDVGVCRVTRALRALQCLVRPLKEDQQI